LCEKGDGNNLSHNQISLPGPQLNTKSWIALTLLRYNKYVMLYDLEKAFLQLKLRPEDSEKLLFLWFQNVSENDFKFVGYKFLRVPFGLRFSPTLLMLSLYIQLILNADETNHSETEIRNMLYNLAYMDNLGYSSSNSGEVLRAYDTSQSIFNSFGFNLQQFATNCTDLIPRLDDSGVVSEDVKLFGLVWNTSRDTFRTRPRFLNVDADTKKSILSTLNSNYDPLGITLPTLNRAKIFMHELQMDADLPWGKAISETRLKNWRNIAKQINSSIELSLPRFVGDYSSEFNLLAFTDASKEYYGCVLFLQDSTTGQLNFALAKNKIISRRLDGKTIPVLELLALGFGVKCMMEFQKDLTNAFCPVKIKNLELYSDSTIALNWLASKVQKFQKIERKGSIINNNFDKIVKYCEQRPILFHHIDGEANPADFVTRCVSSKVLSNTNYLTGPELTKIRKEFSVMVPHPYSKSDLNSCMSTNSNDVVTKSESVVPLDKYSSFARLCKVTQFVRKFVGILIEKVQDRKPHLFTSFKKMDISHKRSCTILIQQSQRHNYPDVLNYFADSKNNSEPPIISQLNLFIDTQGIVRVNLKMRNQSACYKEKFPILRSKNCPLSKSILHDLHLRLKHGGIFKMLSLLRKEFWITLHLVL
jgi:hypothetical protein